MYLLLWLIMLDAIEFNWLTCIQRQLQRQKIEFTIYQIYVVLNHDIDDERKNKVIPTGLGCIIMPNIIFLLDLKDSSSLDFA